MLGVFMPTAQAASLVTIPTIATNVWQLFAGPRLGFLLRRLWLLMVGVCVGTWIGVGFLVGASSQQASVALGAVLCAYGCYGLTAPSFKKTRPTSQAPALTAHPSRQGRRTRSPSRPWSTARPSPQ